MLLNVTTIQIAAMWGMIVMCKRGSIKIVSSIRKIIWQSINSKSDSTVLNSVEKSDQA